VPPTSTRAALTVEQCWQPVPGGSGTYIVELTRELALRDDVEATGVAARHGGPAPADWTPGVPVRHSRLPRRLLYDAWQRLPGPRAEAIAGDVDVVHATTWAIPPTRRPLVVTVHDVAFLHDPSHFTARGNRFFRRALEQTTAAVTVVVPSRATADDCVAVGIPAARIEVVPHGARIGPPDPARVAALRARHGLERPYVLWCGTVEPRKNLPGLLTGFASVADELPGTDLVLVGPTGWGEGLTLPDHVRDRVHVLGRLDREDLDAAFAGADAFVFPSLREGFGLPVVEAMAHGLPVVTSRGTSCAEVGGDAAVLVDPLDTREIGRGIVTALGARDELSPRSRARAAQFTWAAAAARTAEIYAAATR